MKQKRQAQAQQCQRSQEVLCWRAVAVIAGRPSSKECMKQLQTAYAAWVLLCHACSSAQPTGCIADACLVHKPCRRPGLRCTGPRWLTWARARQCRCPRHTPSSACRCADTAAAAAVREACSALGSCAQCSSSPGSNCSHQGRVPTTLQLKHVAVGPVALAAFYTSLICHLPHHPINRLRDFPAGV